MVHKCVVSGCPNSSNTIIHYILPEEPKRLSLWLQFIQSSKPAGELIPQSCRVCGDHFSPESFTQLDLGFTTRFILNIDAVPTVYHSDRATKQGAEAQAAGPEKEMDESCSITISSTVSLSGVKDEPFEYEVSHVTKPVEETKSASTRRSVKQEESQSLFTAETCSEESKQPQVNSKADMKRESSRSSLGERSKDNKRFSCSTCGQTFRNKCVLMEHENNHMEEQTDRTYRCKQCGKGFEQLVFLKAHEKVHKSAQASVKLENPPCPPRFQYNHASQDMYKCPICEEVHSERSAFALHIKKAHARSKLMCSFCDKSFGRIDEFFRHIDSHIVVTPFYCSICKVYQLNKQGYMCHMRIHKKKPKDENAPRKVERKVKETGNGTKFSQKEVNMNEGETKVPMQTEETSEVEAESVESEGTGTVQIVPESNLSLPSPEELSYTDTSGETEDSDDFGGTDER
ncbi:zinc finger and BTB domain-containing protein 24-like [Astyanax mexicanus]|uniref:Zinc finger and BTB domain-containing protein 24-like n=1 Tax=Astyanax mexicanus TaxID=7994 RepID=A0A8B9JWB9_ASTMX|nr:zinc finger and BTB domain-containing protein 24-like [Astyanax mexicanus]